MGFGLECHISVTPFRPYSLLTTTCCSCFFCPLRKWIVQIFRDRYIDHPYSISFNAHDELWGKMFPPKNSICLHCWKNDVLQFYANFPYYSKTYSLDKV